MQTLSRSAWAKGAFSVGIAALLASHPFPALAGSTILDPLQNIVQRTTSTWLDNSLGIAQTLFNMLIMVAWVTAIARYVATNHTIEGIGHMFMDMFMKTIPLLVIMDVAPTFLPNITTYATELAGQMGGTATLVGPDEILNTGGTLVSSLIANAAHPFQASGVQLAVGALTGNPAIFLDSVSLVMACLCAVVVMLAFVFIAVEYLLCFIQCYISIAVGAIALGWLAAPGTKNMGEAYLGACWTSVLRIVVTVSSVSLIMGTISPLLTTLASGTEPSTAVMTYYKLAASAGIAALLAWKIPSYAVHLLTGHPSVTAVHLARSAPAQATADATGNAAVSAGKAAKKATAAIMNKLRGSA